MKKTLTPHLLISVPDSLLAPALRELLTLNCIEIDRAIPLDTVYITKPILAEDGSLQPQATALKYYNVIQVAACYLTRSNFRYALTNMIKLYHPSYPTYHYYVKLSNLAMFNDPTLEKHPPIL